MKKRGDIIAKILETLKEGVENSTDLLDIFCSDYTTSHRKLREIISGTKFKSRYDLKLDKRQEFYSLLNHLKNQGFIKKEKIKSKSSLWKITEKGIKRLNIFKKQKIFSPGDISYQKEADDKIRIIIFDIPEKERHKRTWLRAALLLLDFKLLQKSVWIGKSKIPEKFLFNLRERNMLSYVQIFEISKKGTISQLS